MNLVSILGILTVVGALGAALLTHRLLGIRPGHEDPLPASRADFATSGEGRAVDADLAKFVGQLQSQVARMERHLLESEQLEERTAARLEETEEEVRELRRGALRFDERLHLADESRLLRERETARRQERELERHRERELEESTWQMRDIKGPVATG